MAVPDNVSVRVVAARTFRDQSGRHVTAELLEPTMLGPERWECAFRITGLPNEVEGRAQGFDALQALIIGLQGLRFHLERSAPEFYWLDGYPGYGIPLYIPMDYGLEVEQQLRQLINDEITKFVERKRGGA